MKNTNWLLTSVSLFVLSACAPDKSPSEIYEQYNSQVVQGISFDDDKVYYTKRKQQEVESKFPQYMESMKKSRKEVIQAYLEFSQELAKCKKIELAKEIIDGNAATLEYLQTDICGNESNSEEKQTVEMIYESGWKIDDVVISI